MVRMVLAALLLLAPVSASALEGLQPGDAAPSFSLRTLAGERVGLADLAGSPAVVIFWSTWSPRSAEVLADFAARHPRWSADGLRVVAVNADGERRGAVETAIRDYLSRMELPFPVVIDEGLATYAAYGVLALPTVVLLDPQGRVAYALGGYPLTLREELEAKVEVALGNGGPPGPAVANGPAPGTACPIPRVRAARAADGTAVELSASTLAFLQRHWLAGKAAPGEERILGIFTELATLRDCYRRLAAGG